MKRVRRFPTLAVLTWLYVLWSLLPVLIAARISLNDGRSRSTFQSMSFRWYWGDHQSSVLPLLAPAIFASVMVVFATSVDDFVISSFLSSGAGTETVPIKIYSGARAGSTPALNALATVMLTLTLLAVTLAALCVRWANKRGGTAPGQTAGFARLTG